MSEVAGTFDMPGAIRKVLEERADEIFLFEIPTFEENAAKLRRELMFDWYMMAQVRTPPSAMKIVTDVS